MSATTVKELEAKVDALEHQRFSTDDNAEAVVIDDSVRRARASVEQLGIYSAAWKFVPPPYYTWPLEKRAECLRARSIQYLCKSLLLENKKAPSYCSGAEADEDPTNPKFVLVVLQYAATLDEKKLTNAIRALRKDVKSRLDDSKFDFRIASEEDNRVITGYEHNSVTPFGLLRPVPIVLSSALEPLKFFWMGGGHEHLKLGMAYSDFCRSLSPIVADISTPRTALELSSGIHDEGM